MIRGNSVSNKSIRNHAFFNECYISLGMFEQLLGCIKSRRSCTHDSYVLHRRFYFSLMNLNAPFRFQRRSLTYLPSVAFLINKHALSNETLQLIKGTGPKNRILKGDILEFIKNGVNSFVESVQNESWHYTDLNLRNVQKLKVDALSLLLTATLKSLQKMSIPWLIRLQQKSTNSFHQTKFRWGLANRIGQQ